MSCARVGLLVLVGLTLAAAGSAQSEPFLFEAPILVEAGGDSSLDSALVDLDGDGRLDVVLAGIDGMVGVALRTASGGFDALVTYPTEAYPSCLLPADLDGDGHADIVAVNEQGDSLSIFMGLGDGTLGTPATLPADASPTGVAAGDVTGDGILDLVVSSNGLGIAPGSVAVYPGAGSGSFGARSVHPVDADPEGITLGDFDDEGTLDIALADGTFPGSAIVLLGQGGGTFGSPTNYSADGGPQSIVTGDLNRDGVLDLVTGNFSGDDVSVLLGLGAGDFASPVQYPVGDKPRRVCLVDLDGDGALDVATAVWGTNRVAVLRGLGDGTLAAPEQHVLEDGPLSVTSGDVNADGAADLSVAGASYVKLLLGRGDGSFALPATYATPQSPRLLERGDMNDDGRLDVVVVSSFTQTVSVLLGQGAGVLGAPISASASPWSNCLEVADLNGDERLDVALGIDNEHTGISLLFGTGGGGLQPSGFIPLANAVRDIDSADVDGDGITDLVFIEPGVVGLLRGLGGGAFGPLETYGDGSLRSFELGDLSGDGRVDVALVRNDGLAVLLGLPGGGFAAPVPHASGAAPWDAALGDLDGDGLLDVVVMNSSVSTDYLAVLYGLGGGALSPALLVPCGNNPGDVELADVDGDGALDAVVANDLLFTAWISVLRGRGRDGFEAPTGYGVARIATDVAVGDFDGNGGADVAVTNSSYSSVTVLLSRLGWTWTDLGSALPGTLGAPQLVGSGSLSVGGSGALVLSQAAPSSAALLLASLGSGPVPFVCGSLAAAPPLALVPLVTNGAGGMTLSWSAWPVDLSGLELVVQYAVADAGAPCGVALSNAVRADAR